MSCAARYQETTSLEFILNPFKFFFTNYVVKIAPQPALVKPCLMTKIRSPTIVAHSSEKHDRRAAMHLSFLPCVACAA
ncbi:hypothetical protein FRZ40_04100 [Paraburkholderia azotifigens]|uniref:Uncharacterized protein n=1 Tax=Paraburkholderia azotifigens TaxID=2057004 RepID=A0A5C6VSX6_9BURK|nr:hypothetical protein FRZ40_04100 [Paraburkholderia azotifigens]